MIHESPDMGTPDQLAFAARLRSIGLSSGYASEIAVNGRKPSDVIALKIWRELGVKVGSLVSLNDDEIAVLAKVRGEAA